MKDFFSSPLPYPYPLSSPGLKVLGCLVNQDPTLSPGGCSLPLLEPSLLSFSDHHFQQFSGAGCLHIWSQNLHCVVVKAEAYCHLTWNKSLKRWALSLPCVGKARVRAERSRGSQMRQGQGLSLLYKGQWTRGRLFCQVSCRSASLDLAGLHFPPAL